MVDINNTNSEFKSLLFSFHLERDRQRECARERVCVYVFLCVLSTNICDRHETKQLGGSTKHTNADS